MYVITCPDCGRILEWLLYKQQYPDLEGAMNVFQCMCGAVTGVFLYDDPDRNLAENFILIEVEDEDGGDE